MENTEKEQILSEIVSTQSLPDYEAINVLWGLLTKATNLVDGADERQKMLLLLERIPEEDVKRLLKDASVDSLVFMDPPLETVLADPGEKPDEDSTMRIIGKLRSSRDSGPRDALINLGEVLKRIRDKYINDFKTGPTDKEILTSARKALYLLCITAISKLD
jgi:hypothetical protein